MNPEHKIITELDVEYDGTLILKFGDMADDDYESVYFPMNLRDRNTTPLNPLFIGKKYNTRSKTVIV